MKKLLTSTLLKVTLLHECISRFLNYTNGTKARNIPHLWLLVFLNLMGNYLRQLQSDKSLANLNRERSGYIILSELFSYLAFTVFFW